MGEKSKTKKEPYIIVPMNIFNIAELNGDEKMLLSHIYSFGSKGCWQSNKTIAKMFNTSPNTISRWISKIKKYTYTKCPKGYYRTIWVKSHPDVKEAVKLHKSGITTKNRTQNTLIKNDEEHTQKCVSECSKSAISLTQKCITTNNITNKETITETIEQPVPLPAGGQAPAALEERTQARKKIIENLMETLGQSKRGIYEGLNEKKTRDAAQIQRNQLYATL